MPDTVKIKIENLQKVCTEFSNQKRQKTDDTDNSTSNNTVDLYGDNEHAGQPPKKMPTISEPNEAPDEDVLEDTKTKLDSNAAMTQEPGNTIDLTSILAEDEFIPIGS